MGYLENWNLRYASPQLKSRATAAIAKAAQDVLNESPETTNHAARVLWAKAALVDAGGMAEKMLWGIVGNSNVQAAEAVGSTADAGWRDSKCDEAVAGLIDIFAEGL